MIGGKSASNEVKARGAQRSGWSPIYADQGGTKQAVMDALYASLKAGKIKQEEFDEYKGIIKLHFANLYEDVLWELNAGN